jgi:N-methylhydantoinase B
MSANPVSADRATDDAAVRADEVRRRHESFRYGYLPPAELTIDPSLSFNDARAESLDPITYEVLRSKLWNLNIDHGETLRRVSGSNIVVEGYDFNTSLLTGRGEGAVFGPNSIFFAGCADLVVKWTLEHRSSNVGIHDGDIFMQDDPWIGTNHQMDTAVFGPVFVDGGLFAWIYNCAHQRELGGVEPGGFIQDARDVYSEATFMPPIKLADATGVREDVVDAWTRRSRLPEVMVLELKSQLAGYRFARRRLLELVERYGPATIKAVMERTIDITADIVGQRLERLPDAVWRDERYVAGAVKGDHKPYRVCLSYEKRGSRLRVTNAGTDPSVGSFNITPGVLRAVVMNGLFPVIAYDQYLCGAGLLRQIDFEPVRGTITSASHPSAVSTSLGTLVALAQAQNLASKMCAADPELSRHAFAGGAAHTASYNGMSGIDQYGGHYHDLTLDTVAGGVGAFSFRDGIDHGGPLYATMSPISDVEKYERSIPFLYLYRREMPTSGGHGEWRGGCTLASAWVGHRTEHSTVASGGLIKSVTQGLGLAGGHPATGGYQWHATDTGIQEWFRTGRIPSGPDALRALAPHGGLAEPKRYDNRLGIDDLFEVLPNPGAGFGDPLERQVELVARDLEQARVSADDARQLYGVVSSAAGSVDAAATERARHAIRYDRRARARLPRVPHDAAPGGAPASSSAGHRSLLVTGVAIGGDADRTLSCAACGHVLGLGAHGYRSGCCELDTPLGALGPFFTDPMLETSVALVFRQFLCPGCLRVIDGQICRPTDIAYTDAVLLPEG